jgi:transcriptional regulator with XRE-family HTH domain
MQPLRTWRTGKLMSVRELADAAGVAPKTLTDLEYGRRRPNYDTMRRIAAALGVDPLEVAEFAAAISSRCTVSNGDN